MDVARTVLPFVAVLACPLMMIVCIVGMRRTSGASPQVAGGDATDTTRSERIAVLERQVEAIQAELTVLRSDPTTPTPGASETAPMPVVGGRPAERYPA